MAVVEAIHPDDAFLAAGDPLAVAVTNAIKAGDVDLVRHLCRDNGALATVRIGDSQTARTLLHLVTDWPGHFPNAAAVVAVLVEAGADVNARFTGSPPEAALHWAASSDDVDVLDALIDCGADLEAGDGVIGGGTPLADAVAFGQWAAARRLVERGAKTTLWQAAALGMLDRVEASFAKEPPAGEEITNAFWLACHGGQQATAAYLLERGADIDWVGYDDLTPLDAARREGAHDVVEWLGSRGATSAAERG